MRRLRTIPFILLLVTCAAGCASPEPVTAVTDALESAPLDFTVDLLILCGWGFPDSPVVHLRPGRLVLFPDGSLHYGEPEAGQWRDQGDRSAGWLPPRTRTLDRRQVAEIWSLANQLGFGDRANAEPPTDLERLAAPRGGITYALTLTGNGDRWGFVRSAGGDEVPDPASVEFTRRLAELAWASDVALPRVMVIPRRYDLGPDPYARYRQR